MSITDKHIDVNRLINDMPNVDIGFSYVVRDECWDYLDDIVELSETSNNVTHIRFTHDIMDESNWDLMDTFKDKYKTKTKCIFQSRNNFTKGMNVCYISKLKPLVDPTGSVYPCCGVQYANVNNDSKDLTSDFKMCNWRDFHNTKEFNGSKCSRCFYNDYNRIFNIINDDNVNHLSFV